MLSHIIAVADFLNIPENKRKFLECLPVLKANLDALNGQWKIRVDIPNDLSKQEKQAWKRNWSEHWDALSHTIDRFQPRGWIMSPQLYQQMHGIMPENVREQLEKVKLSTSCKGIVEQPKQFYLPHAKLTKQDEVLIMCKNVKELELIAALGVPFPRSMLYAQKFYKEHGIPYHLLSLQEGQHR